jgi:tRNA(Arg) A34 adenosine deaminase TadA
MLSDHRDHLRRCIDAVRRQADVANYPVAASVVMGNETLSLACSALPARPDPSAHPEMCAIRTAAARVGSRYLPGAVLYSTLEPCPMCTAVAIWAKMDGIVFGVSQEEAADFARACGTSTLTWRQIRIPACTVAAAGSPRIWVKGGLLHNECLSLLELTAERSTVRANDEG